MNRINDIMNLFNTITENSNKVYCKEFDKCQKQIDKIQRNEVIDILCDSKKDRFEIDYKMDKLKTNQNKIKTFINFKQFFINEIKKIDTIETDIPNNILPLLSEYGTFYFGNNILYINKEIDNYTLLICLINHISHYILDCHLKKQHYVKNKIYRIYSVIGLLDKEKIYDYNEYIIRYFDKIYREDIENIFCFEPNKGYKDFMTKQIEDNNFCRISKYVVDDYYCYCHINKHFKAKEIFDSVTYEFKKMDHIKGKATKSPHKFNFSPFYNGEYIKESSFLEIDKETMELLKKNNMKVIKPNREE